MWRGLPCVIRQWCQDGSAVISGARFRRRAEPGELDPLPVLPLFERWAAMRIASIGGGVLTTAADAFDDYLNFARNNPEPGDSAPLGQRAFAYAMRRAGFLATKARLRDEKGNGRWYSCWCLILRPGPSGGLQ